MFVVLVPVLFVVFKVIFVEGVAFLKRCVYITVNVLLVFFVFVFEVVVFVEGVASLK